VGSERGLRHVRSLIVASARANWHSP
jgi:hypothetical protein